MSSSNDCISLKPLNLQTPNCKRPSEEDFACLLSRKRTKTQVATAQAFWLTSSMTLCLVISVAMAVLMKPTAFGGKQKPNPVLIDGLAQTDEPSLLRLQIEQIESLLALGEQASAPSACEIYILFSVSRAGALPNPVFED